MNCNCIKETEQKMIAKGCFAAKCKNISYALEDGLKKYLTIPFSYKSKKKDGTLIKREKEIGVIAKFCPFCGEKLI